MSKDYEEFMDSQKKGKVKGMSFEIDTKTTIILVLLGVIFGMIARLQGWV